MVIFWMRGYVSQDRNIACRLIAWDYVIVVYWVMNLIMENATFVQITVCNVIIVYALLVRMDLDWIILQIMCSLVRYVEEIVQIVLGLIRKLFVQTVFKLSIWVYDKISVCPVLINVSSANQVVVLYVKKVFILIHKIAQLVRWGAKVVLPNRIVAVAKVVIFWMRQILLKSVYPVLQNVSNVK